MDTTPIIDQSAPIYVVGIELRTSNEVAAQEIPPFWQRFYQEDVLGRIPNKVSGDIFSVYTCFAHPGQDNNGVYSMILGAQVHHLDDVPADMVSTTIAPSKRAVFTVEKGRPDKVGEKWMEIWGRTDLKKTFIAEYECYKPSGEIEILIGVLAD